MQEKITVQQIDDREIWVNECKLRLGEDNIIYNKAAKNPDEELALAINEAILQLANRVEGKVGMLIDITNTGRPSAKARKIFSSLEDHDKIRKHAFFGAHPVARILASFFMTANKKKNLAFFETKEEAMAWLKE